MEFESSTSFTKGGPLNIECMVLHFRVSFFQLSQIRASDFISTTENKKMFPGLKYY